MSDLFDYLAWRGDIPLSQVPFGPVDGLILSTLSYVRFQELVPDSPSLSVPLQQAAEAFLALPEQEAEDRVRCRHDLPLLKALLSAPRFASLPLTFYQDCLDPEREMQFSALTVLLDTGEALLVFRGTDNTLVGWKEDFNLSFLEVVPAQSAALNYTARLAAARPGPLLLAGHSKGGNLAVFSASLSPPELRDRIGAVYSYDSPGFTQRVLSAPGYQELLPRIRSYVPQSSVVGMLLEHEEPYTVVKSRHLGIFQHDPYTWAVRGGSFICLEELSSGSRNLDLTLKNWLAGLTPQDRERFLDSLYQAFEDTQAQELEDLAQPRRLYTLIQGLVQLDEETRSHILLTLKKLLRAAADVLREDRSGPDA